MDITIKDRFETTPYAAIPILPFKSKIIILKTTITIPEASSPISEGKPRDKVRLLVFLSSFTLRK